MKYKEMMKIKIMNNIFYKIKNYNKIIIIKLKKIIKIIKIISIMKNILMNWKNLN